MQNQFRVHPHTVASFPEDFKLLVQANFRCAPSPFIWCGCLTVNEGAIVRKNTVIYDSQASSAKTVSMAILMHMREWIWDKQPESSVCTACDIKLGRSLGTRLDTQYLQVDLWAR